MEISEMLEYPARDEPDLFEGRFVNLVHYSASSREYQKMVYTTTSVFGKFRALWGMAYSRLKFNENLQEVRLTIKGLEKRKNQEAYFTLYGRDPLERRVELLSRVGHLL